MIKKCAHCSKVLSYPNTKYCSNKCQREFEYQQRIKQWKAGKLRGYTGKCYQVTKWLRRYILEKYHFKCSLCGWSGINPYTHSSTLCVDHIDGDARNDTEKNLRAICPNCHSLTETYCSLNRNSIRDRRNYTGKKQW